MITYKKMCVRVSFFHVVQIVQIILFTTLNENTCDFLLNMMFLSFEKKQLKNLDILNF